MLIVSEYSETNSQGVEVPAVLIRKLFFFCYEQYFFHYVNVNKIQLFIFVNNLSGLKPPPRGQVSLETNESNKYQVDEGSLNFFSVVIILFALAYQSDLSLIF